MTALDLPPLPEPDWKEAWAVPGMPVAERWFGHAKMHAYALAAVLAERERCACIAEGRPLLYGMDEWDSTAGAIRAQWARVAVDGEQK